MKCPRCTSQLVEMQNGDVAVDVCFNGCGGVWFDWMELKKMDEAHEADPKFLKDLAKSAHKKLDLTEKIDCPKCEKQPMHRRFSSVKRKVELDECPVCGGFWLDAGELVEIQKEFKTEKDRKDAAEKFISETFGGELAHAKTKTQSLTAQTQKFQKGLRLICPSTYLTKMK